MVWVYSTVQSQPRYTRRNDVTTCGLVHPYLHIKPDANTLETS